MSNSLVKLSSVIKATACSKSAIYESIKKETFPPAIKLSLRSVAWVQSEVEAWIKAKIAGATEDKLKELVRSLVAKRQAFPLH